MVGLQCASLGLARSLRCLRQIASAEVQQLVQCHCTRQASTFATDASHANEYVVMELLQVCSH